MVDVERVKVAVRELLLAIGEDPEREGLKETPRRVAEALKELLSGMGQDPRQYLRPIPEVEHEEMVVIRGIKFHSLCEHHLLPFFGEVHVAYIPKGRVVGISHVVRAVEALSRRLQVQERMTKELADALMDAIKPWGVMVVVEAEHLCMTMRGVKKPGSKVVTSAVRGTCRTSKTTREEALALITGARERKP
ncbi:MAG TPA: GTP cyclohydrolase I FolE [Armatimonadetes bacterium]|nr:GTP cyclohydrolase I FolE [Armatimonadota bacterium]